MVTGRFVVDTARKILETPICDIPKISALDSITEFSHEFRYEYGGVIHTKRQILLASVYRTSMDFQVHLIYDEEMFVIKGTNKLLVETVEVTNSKEIRLVVLFSREGETAGKSGMSIKELYNENK